MTATLGEFLLAAEQRYTEAEVGATGPRDHEALAVQARRMVTVLGRYLDTVVACGMTTDQVSEIRQQTNDIHTTLHEAGACLDQAMAPARSPAWAWDLDDPIAARYTRAVNALAAGSELLRTHMVTDRYGQPQPRSDWAQLLATRPVVTALADEIANGGLVPGTWWPS